jgi:hypothetical protein
MSYGWLWPGLPQMWVSGQWRGLFVAVGFGVALESWFLSVSVWNEWLGATAVRLLGLFVFAFWIVGTVLNRRWISRCRHGAEDDAGGDLFPAALAEYLQGNWFAAEQRCRELIARRKDDVDARLLLATLLRHTSRRDEARAELDQLVKCDGAAKWALEIAHERARLEDAEEEPAAEQEIVPEEAIRRAA